MKMFPCTTPLSRLVLLILATLLPAATALGGTLILGNGDRISGELIGIYNQQVHWQADLMGEVVVGQVDVRTIDSHDKFRIVLDAKRELSACQLQASDGRQWLDCDQGMVALNSWRLVERVTARPLNAPDAWRNTGFVAVAGRDRGGNSQERTLQLDGKIELRKGPVRHIATAHYDRTSSAGVKTADDRKFTYQFDYFISPKWFFNSNLSWEQNQFQELESRTLLGAGLGYQFFDTELIRLSVELGPAFMRSQYIDDADRSNTAIRESTDLSIKLNSRGLEFFHRNTLLQALNNTDDWRVEAVTGFALPIIGNLKAQTTWEFDYNNRPAKDAGPLDRIWSFGLNYGW